MLHLTLRSDDLNPIELSVSELIKLLRDGNNDTIVDAIWRLGYAKEQGLSDINEELSKRFQE